MKYFQFLLLALIAFACAPNREDTLASIKRLESEFQQPGTKTLNLGVGSELFDYYDEFLENNPKDSLVPELLFKAGQLAVGINNHLKAVQYLDAFTAHYPDAQKAPQAFLLLGNFYATKVFDLEKADETYDRFIKTYPNDPMVPQVQFMKNTLGKTSEEIIEMIQAKQSQDSL